MVNESLPETNAALQGALDGALATAFRAPKVPPELRAHVLAAVARERTPDWARRRQEWEQHYRSSIADLNARYLRRCRDAVLAGAVIVVATGLAVKPLLQWLTQFFTSSAPLVAGALALGAGVFCGVIVMRDLFGRLQGTKWPSMSLTAPP